MRCFIDMKNKMNMMKQILPVMLAAMMVSCGGETEEKSSAPAKPQAPRKTSTYEDRSNIPEMVEITIEGNDQMKYNKEKVEVYAGQTVKLTLKHVGQMSKEAMGHNWVLLSAGTDVTDFATEASQARDEDFVPSSLENKTIAYTETLGGGQSTTIEFAAPEKGTYDFICTFPGHYGMMKGKFIVK